jgi:hypothetical protein
MLPCENDDSLENNESYHDPLDQYGNEGAIVCFEMFFALVCELHLLSEKVLRLKEVHDFVGEAICVVLS